MTKNSEWIIHFMSNIDRLLDSFEHLTANYRRLWAENGSLPTRKCRHV